MSKRKTNTAAGDRVSPIVVEQFIRDVEDYVAIDRLCRDAHRRAYGHDLHGYDCHHLDDTAGGAW